MCYMEHNVLLYIVDLFFAMFGVQNVSLFMTACLPTSIQSFTNQYIDLLMIEVDTSRNTLRPIQNGSHFADDIFKCTLLNEDV